MCWNIHQCGHRHFQDAFSKTMRPYSNPCVILYTNRNKQTSVPSLATQPVMATSMRRCASWMSVASWLLLATPKSLTVLVPPPGASLSLASRVGRVAGKAGPECPELSRRRQVGKAWKMPRARFRWSSGDGWLRALCMLEDRYGDRYDVSRMDEAWWKAHVKGAFSKLDVTCRHCGHRSRSMWVNNLRKGQSPGCFCNGGVPWSSPAGRARCLEMIWARYGGQYDVRRMDEAWWKAHVQDCNSKLDVTCRHCGHRSRSTWVQGLQQGTAPGCFCNGGVPWSSPAGRARCLEMIWERYGGQYDVRRMDEAWWKAHVKDQTSKLDVTCRYCGHRSRRTSVSNLQKGRSPGCFCNGGVPWSSPAGRARCLEIIWERYGGQYDVRRMDEAWWKAHVKRVDSKLDVTCRHCGHRSRSTKLNNLQQGQSPGCLCSRKTEGKLMRWLAQNFSQFDVTSQVRGCTSPASNRTLPFDFGLNNDTILIELDGNIGHFGLGWGGSEDDGGVPQRDHFKEQWALRNGRTVVRLLQEDVHSDSWDWKSFVTSTIQHSIRNSRACVLTQDAVEYKSGIYSQLRGGLHCQVGHFRTSRGDRIPYLAYAAEEADFSFFPTPS